MSCTNPNLVSFGVDAFGEITHKFLGPAAAYRVDENGCMPDLESRGWYAQLVPCGKCPSCLSDKARDWSNRCLMELQSSKCAIFVTLTYNDFHLPIDDNGPSLRVEDCQKFMKRLRKFFSDKRIRFLLSGEYGSKTQRPHYHAILFGLRLSDFPDLRLVKYNNLKQPLFTSPMFAAIWSHGIVSIGSVSKQSCDYVCRYVLKKQHDLNSDDTFYAGRKPPFILSSRRPGIGLLDCEKYLAAPEQHIVVDGKDGLVYDFPVPRSVWRHCKDANTGLDILADMRYNNTIRSRERLESLLNTYNLPYPEILRRQAEEKARHLKLLPERSVE